MAAKKPRPAPDPEQTARARAIHQRLTEALPELVVELDFDDPWQLLMATIMAAQSTDKTVNRVAPALFERFSTPAALAAAPPEEGRQEIQGRFSSVRCRRQGGNPERYPCMSGASHRVKGDSEPAQVRRGPAGSGQSRVRGSDSGRGPMKARVGVARAETGWDRGEGQLAKASESCFIGGAIAPTG
jgi:hypothetical protein